MTSETHVPCDTKIETEVELFDVLAKYSISKVTVQFKTDITELCDIHAMTFDEGATTVPDDVRDAIRIAVETFSRARSDQAKVYVHSGHDDEEAEWGEYEDWPTFTFDVARREIRFEGDFVQITCVRNERNVDDEARWAAEEAEDAEIEE